MSYKIRQPFAQFFGLDGKPLEGGFIYFGEVNKNPQTDPIMVYSDDGLTQPVAQPLRTSGGYVSLNGKPIQMFTADTAMSVACYDSDRGIVFYLPEVSGGESLLQFIADLANSSDPEKGAALIGRVIETFGSVADMVAANLVVGRQYRTTGYYTPGDGGGAAYVGKVAGTAFDGLIDHEAINGVVAAFFSEDFITPQQAGAKATGAADGSGDDDTASVLAAVNYAKTKGIKLYLTGRYLITSQITLGRLLVQGQGMVSTGFYKKGNFNGIRFLEEHGTYQDFFCIGTPGNTGHGFYAADGELAKRQRCARLFSAGHGGDGFNIGSCNLSIWDSCESNNNTGRGFRFGGFDANALTVVNLDARNNGSHGFDNGGSYNMTAIGGYTTNNGGIGWRIAAAGGRYFGIGGESDAGGTLTVAAGAARNYIVLGVSYDYNDLSDVADANTIVAARDSTKLKARELFIRNSDANDGGLAFSSSSSGVLKLTKDDATRNLKIALTGTSATASIDMTELGAGRGLIMRDQSNGNRYFARINGGAWEIINLGP